MNFCFRCGDGFGQRDFFPLLERGTACVRDFQHAEFFGSLPEKTEAHKLAADGGPFGAAVFLADAVSRKLRVTPLADFFRIRASQNFDDVIQSDAKTVFLADAIDAGKKFLRGERAVKRGARGKTVVTRAATVSGKFLAEICEQFAAPAIR